MHIGTVANSGENTNTMSLPLLVVARTQTPAYPVLPRSRFKVPSEEHESAHLLVKGGPMGCPKGDRDQDHDRTDRGVMGWAYHERPAAQVKQPGDPTEARI